MNDVLLTSIRISELETLIQNSVRKVLRENVAPQIVDNKQDAAFISITEASVFLNLAKATIYGFVSAGKIPYMKQGKKLYFTKQELTEWLQAGRKNTAATIAAEVDKHIISKKI